MFQDVYTQTTPCHISIASTLQHCTTEPLPKRCYSLQSWQSACDQFCIHAKRFWHVFYRTLIWTWETASKDSNTHQNSDCCAALPACSKCRPDADSPVWLCAPWSSSPVLVIVAGQQLQGSECGQEVHQMSEHNRLRYEGVLVLCFHG